MLSMCFFAASKSRNRRFVCRPRRAPPSIPPPRPLLRAAIQPAGSLKNRKSGQAVSEIGLVFPG